MNLADYLATLPHDQLYRMRAQGQIPQELLGPMEHRAFAREYAQESPLAAAISLPFAIPAYSAYKATGLSKSRSPASLEEIKQAYLGLLEGLRK